MWLRVGIERRAVSAAARAAGVSSSTIKGRLRLASKFGLTIPVIQKPGEPTVGHAESFTYTKTPDPDLPVEELIKYRIRQFSHKRAHEEARKLIHVKVGIDGPIGIWHFGDPHLDDDGTDLGLVTEHVDLIQKTEGLFGANVGDTSNNWTGRLAPLWSQQSTSAKQMWQLVKWFIESTQWLYCIGGNHDCWSGDGDPIKWFMEGQEAPYAPSEVRLQLDFPNKNFCRINARHDFAGHSQYNPAHGPSKSIMFGVRDHINICGHKHSCGHSVIKDPENGWACHAFQVASYKFYDRYAREHGFRDQYLSPGVMTVINTEVPNTHPDFVTHFWDMDTGIFFLKALRRRYK